MHKARDEECCYNGQQQETIVYCCIFSPSVFSGISDWLLHSSHQVTLCQDEAETYAKKVRVSFVLFMLLTLLSLMTKAQCTV